MGPGPDQDTFVLRCEGPLTLANAAHNRERLRQAVDRNTSVVIDISETEDVDITFVQLAIAAQKSAAVSGKRIFIGADAANPSFAKLESAHVSSADLPPRVDPPVPAAAATVTSNAVDPSAISTLINELGASAVRQSLDVFFSEMSTRLDALGKLAAPSDAPAIRREAHLLKGSAATFGLVGLAADVAALERDAEIIAAVAYKATVARMAMTLQDSRAALQAVASAA